MQKNCKGSLYLTYDGLLDPLGRSQVVPYLERFAREGLEVTVISFEKMGASPLNEKRRVQQKLAEQGIEWIPLRYHK